jgi:hypothetical protein
METLNPIKPATLESVLCLDCGDVYVKPTRGGTLKMNPGCPHCGYVGWSPLTIGALSEERRPDRFVADRRPHLLAIPG